MNHFTEYSPRQYKKISGQNNYNKIKKHITDCKQALGFYPNFVTVDYAADGDAKRIVNWLNRQSPNKFNPPQ